MGMPTHAFAPSHDPHRRCRLLPFGGHEQALWNCPETAWGILSLYSPGSLAVNAAGRFIKSEPGGTKTLPNGAGANPGTGLPGG